MRVLFISSYGQSFIESMDAIPRVGDKVDAFYEPLPTVTSVVWLPTEGRTSALGFEGRFDAIVTVS